MKKKKYNKLVRDRIPQIIKEKGNDCKFRIADTKEYRQKLIEKLQEETMEFSEMPCIEELADIQEVIDSLVAEYKWSGLQAVAEFKKVTRGSFKEKIILEEVSGD